MPAGLLYLVLVLVLCGVALWALTQFPIDATIMKLIRVLIIVIAVVYVIYFLFGLVGGAPHARPLH